MITHRSDFVQKRLASGPISSAAFDAQFSPDISEISFELSIVDALIALGVENGRETKEADLYRRLGGILRNAAFTVVSALELTRLGYGLQPGILLRSTLEGVAVVFDIVVNDESRKRFLAKTYSPTKAPARARGVFKIIGPLYGALSEHHTHIKASHESDYALDPLGDTARANLMLVKAGTALVAIATEMLFHRSAGATRYWRVSPQGITFAPHPQVLELLRDFPMLKSSPGQSGGTSGSVKLFWPSPPKDPEGKP